MKRLPNPRIDNRGMLLPVRWERPNYKSECWSLRSAYCQLAIGSVNPNCSGVKSEMPFLAHWQGQGKHDKMQMVPSIEAGKKCVEAQLHLIHK